MKRSNPAATKTAPVSVVRVGWSPVPNSLWTIRRYQAQSIETDWANGTTPAPSKTSPAATTGVGNENTREQQMAFSRRQVLLGGAGALSAASFPLARPAIA